MASDRDWKKATDDKEKYQLYLASREWCKLREEVRERSGDRCERCEILPMDACHHLSYANKYKEKLEDLQAICNPCHEFTHGKSDFDPLANKVFIRWLALPYGEFSAFTLESSWWLQPGSIKSLLEDIFNWPELLPVMQLWLSCGFAGCGSAETVEFYKTFKSEDGDTVEDCGEIPTSAEMKIHKMFSPGQYAFWSWLKWGGPCEDPVGSVSAFKKCKELAARTQEPRRTKPVDEFSSYAPPTDF